VESALIRKRSSIALVSLVALAIAGLPSAAGAAAGDLDPSFGVGGKVVTDFGGDEFGSALILQPNGKLVLGGGDGRDFLLARYLPTGALDPIFGENGKVTTDFGRDEGLRGLAFRPGQLVAAGTTFSALPLPSSVSSASPSLSGAAFAVSRYRLDGSLDPTFDEDGRATTDFGGRSAGAEDVVIQADGRVVVVGSVSDNTSNDSDFAVARFDIDGSLDSTFGAGGLVVTDLGTQEDEAQGVSLQDDGRIVVAGRSGPHPTRDFALVRYNADGSLDGSFDGDGKVTVDFGGLDFAFDLAIQADGKIVAVGATVPPDAEHDFAVARLNPDGSLDTQGLDPRMDAPFGTGGKVTTDFEDEGDQATSVAIEPSGKILVAGLATPAGTADLGDFGLARYNVDGSLDSGFGASGKLTTSFSAAEDVPWGVVVQRDARILLAGSAGVGSSYDFALARYLVRGCCTVEGSPPGVVPGPLP